MNKKPRLDKPLVDTTEETNGKFSFIYLFSYLVANFSEEDRQVREETHERVSHIAGLMPFVNWTKYEAEGLISVANFLRTELVTLQHSILYSYGQYKQTLSQLDEVNRTRLAKLKIIDEAMEVESTEASTSGSFLDASSSKIDLDA